MINGMFKLISQRPSESKDVYWLWRLREIFSGQTIRLVTRPNVVQYLTGVCL